MSELATPARVGPLLREWRQRRRLSQLDLALEAGVSARHVSFVETGRSRPSPEMVLHLAEELDVPLRDRNRLLLAAGYAPVFEQHDLDDPEMTPVRQALQLILDGHEPYPAVVVDASWEMVAANSSVALLTEGVAPHLLEPPLNVLRVSLHPEGVAPRIANLPAWRAHLLHRLRRQVDATADAELEHLYDELVSYPGGSPDDAGPDDALVALLHLRAGDDVLTFVSTVTTFGTPVDVTTDELTIEAFYPADARTAALLGVDR
jgi:transcriptional regulator with XRE-family HTH domain